MMSSKSKKCPQCGLVNFASDDTCKRCKSDLSIAPLVQPPSVTELEIAQSRPKISRNCPQCESPETRSFEMAYASSTATGTLAAGSYNFNGGGMTLTGGNFKQQSALAAYVTPPSLPRRGDALIVVVCLGSLILLALPLGIFVVDAGFVIFGALLIIAIPLLLGVLVYKYQSKEYDTQMKGYRDAIAHWHRSWICLRCGYRWAI